YAKHLFQSIQFPPTFGPAGKRRLRGSETFVNLALEAEGVPIFYTDHAVVQHHVAAEQVTRGKLLKPSYLNGVEQSRREILFFGGVKRPLQAMRSQVLELSGMLRANARVPGEAQPFC